MSTGSFPGERWPGHCVDPSPPSSAEIKERVELYSYKYVQLGTKFCLIYLFDFFTCFGYTCAHHQEEITLSMRHCCMSLWVASGLLVGLERAPSWSYLQDYTGRHGQQNIKCRAIPLLPLWACSRVNFTLLYFSYFTYFTDRLYVKSKTLSLQGPVM